MGCRVIAIDLWFIDRIMRPSLSQFIDTFITTAQDNGMKNNSTEILDYNFKDGGAQCKEDN
jgi:hypothetical protein